MCRVGYHVCLSKSLLKLGEQVEHYQSLGWVCQGGIACKDGYLYQAMVKPEKQEDET